MDTRGKFVAIALELILSQQVGVTENGCLLWMGKVGRGGYGFVEVRINGERRRYAVHRLLYQHFHGKLPWSKVIRHTCNVRRCINPEHWIPGSKLENTADMIRAGRAFWQNPPADQEPKIVGYQMLPQKKKLIFGRY